MKGTFIVLISIGGSWIDISVNVCIIELFKNNNLDKWMQIAHGAFGIGGLLGPYLVYIFETNTFLYLGLISFILIPFLIWEKSPEDKNNNE